MLYFNAKFRDLLELNIKDHSTYVPTFSTWMWTRWHTFHQRVASGGQAINASQMPEQMKVTMEKMEEVQNQLDEVEDQRKRSNVRKPPSRMAATRR